MVSKCLPEKRHGGVGWGGGLLNIGKQDLGQRKWSLTRTASLACRASGGCKGRGRVSQKGGLQGTTGRQGGQRQLSSGGQALCRERAVSTEARLLPRDRGSAHWDTGGRPREAGQSSQVHTHEDDPRLDQLE